MRGREFSKPNQLQGYRREGKLPPLRLNFSKQKDSSSSLSTTTKHQNQPRHDRENHQHRNLQQQQQQGISEPTNRLGAKRVSGGNGNNGGGKNETIEGSLFRYHGDESTVPPFDIAISYARHLPYRPGMPGPSYTWSAYGRSPKEAIDGFDELLSDVIQSQQESLFDKISSLNLLWNPHEMNELKSQKVPHILPVITERLDESLIVLSEHLKWSIADMVNVMTRKVLLFHFIIIFHFIIFYNVIL